MKLEIDRDPEADVVPPSFTVADDRGRIRYVWCGDRWVVPPAYLDGRAKDASPGALYLTSDRGPDIAMRVRWMTFGFVLGWTIRAGAAAWGWL